VPDTQVWGPHHPPDGGPTAAAAPPWCPTPDHPEPDKPSACRPGRTVEVVHDVFSDPYYASQFALATRPGGTAVLAIGAHK